MRILNLHFTEMVGNDVPYFIWYIGTENTIEEGLSRLFSDLKDNGQILIDGVGIFDYLYNNTDILYCLMYRSLPKLEYLAWRSKKVDKNKKRSKL